MKSKSQQRRHAAMMRKRKNRYFGIVKLPVGTKRAWLSKQDKNGWSLGLALNSRTLWLRGLRFASEKEIRSCFGRKVTVTFIKVKNHA